MLLCAGANPESPAMIGYEINIFINVVCSVIANLICTPHAIKPKLEVYGGIEIMKKIAALLLIVGKK